MRIVVLDGHTLNPGDLDWAPIAGQGELTVHPRTPRDQVIERARGAPVVFTNKAVLDRDALAALDGLRYVGVLATGFNVVDVAAARERGVVVTNVPAYGTASVAQATFALVLELTNHVALHARAVAEGAWSACPDFCFWERPLIELDGLTLGVVGHGAIGRAVAALGRAFGMRVLVHSRTPPRDGDVEAVDLAALFERADVVSLHCPLTAENERFVDAALLARMKPTALLVNTARGALIDERALAEALASGTIAGAALDVLSVEPPPADHPLIGAPNCLITPHNAWASQAARRRLMRIAADNLAAFLRGEPVNVVS